MVAYITSNSNDRQYSLLPTGDIIINKDTSGMFQLSASFNEYDNPDSFDYISQEAIITLGDFNFRIKQLKRNSKNQKKDIVAQHLYFDNVWRRKPVFEASVVSQNLRTFVNYTFLNTGWNFVLSNISENELRFIPDFGNDNVVSMINKVCESFGCIFEILSDSLIQLRRPNDEYNSEFVFTYADNIVVLDENIKTDNLRTSIIAIGKDGIRANYTSTNVNVWGIREAEPVTDESIDNVEDLGVLARNSLQDTPEIEITLDVLELRSLELGENVYLLHRPMGFDAMVNVIGVTRKYNSNDNTFETIAVKVGNVLRKTLSDVVLGLNSRVSSTNTRTENLSSNLNTMSYEVESINSIAPHSYSEVIRQDSNQLQMQQTIEYLMSEVNRLNQEMQSLNNR